MKEMIVIRRRFSNVRLYYGGVTPALEANAGTGGLNTPIVCVYEREEKDVRGEDFDRKTIL